MRAALVLILLAVSATVTAQPKPKIAILGLEVVVANGLPSKDAVRVAQDYTVSLRVHPKAGRGPYAFAPNTERELVDEKLLANCESEAVACMSAIGKNLNVDILMYGKCELVGGNYRISLRLLDVAKKKIVHMWTDVLPAADASGTKLQDHARKGYNVLTQGTTAAAPTSTPPTPPVIATPPPPPNAPACNYDALVAKGDAAFGQGTYAAALASYEAAYKCKADAAIIPKAFATSCKSRNVAKSKAYYTKLSAAQQSTYAQICLREGIDPK